ncbi:MAG: hypothetical protein IJL88_05120 [Clostridia bacterium]|nr:hypothetical protein [Clostridia bacterium]
MGYSLLIVCIILYYVLKANKKAVETKQARDRAAQKVSQKAMQLDQVQAKADPNAPFPTSDHAEQILPDAQIEHAKVSVHVSEHHHENMYAGSMNAEEVQGNPDAYDQMPSEHSAELFVENEEVPQETTDGVHLDFTPSALVNAVIMQEVLQRPKFRHS